jgi:hypothetical protein
MAIIGLVNDATGARVLAGSAASSATTDFEASGAVSTHNSATPVHSATAVGADYLHGIHSGYTDPSHLVWDDGDIKLTITPAHTYYYKGTLVSVAGDNFIVLPGTPDTGQWFVYYDDATGTLTASQTPWDIRDKVMVASVFWNGITGAPVFEGHNSRRDLDWHITHHSTVGAMYETGLDHTAPAAGAAFDDIDIGTGVIWDEDIRFSVGAALTNCRVWYLTDASTYTFENSTRAHLWSGSAVEYINTGTYAKTAISGGQRINTWVYAAPDIARPLYVIVDALAAPYSNTANARAATPPNLAGFGLSNELKLLYKFIWSSTDFIEATDYRRSSALPVGGTSPLINHGHTAASGSGGIIDDLRITGSFSRATPVTETSATHTVASTTSWLICNHTDADLTVTLPSASDFPGREIHIKNLEADYAVISNASNVVPLAGGAAGTDILEGTSDGTWATLVSDGTNWIIMQGN